MKERYSGPGCCNRVWRSELQGPGRYWLAWVVVVTLVSAAGIVTANDAPLTTNAARAVSQSSPAAVGLNGPSLRSVRKHPFGKPVDVPRLAKGVFLVASRDLTDPNFRRSVVLLVAHGEDGAMGVVVNRPTPLTLRQVLPDIGELAERSDQLYIGGPVATSQITLLMRATAPPDNAEHVFRDVYFTGSLKTLMRHIRDENVAETMQAYAGYAGWAPGQLEGEVKRGDWGLAEADVELLFSSSPETIWRTLDRETSGLWVRAVRRHATMAGLPTRW